MAMAGVSTAIHARQWEGAQASGENLAPHHHDECENGPKWKVAQVEVSIANSVNIEGNVGHDEHEKQLRIMLVHALGQPNAFGMHTEHVRQASDEHGSRHHSRTCRSPSFVGHVGSLIMAVILQSPQILCALIEASSLGIESEHDDCTQNGSQLANDQATTEQVTQVHCNVQPSPLIMPLLFNR